MKIFGIETIILEEEGLEVAALVLEVDAATVGDTLSLMKAFSICNKASAFDVLIGFVTGLK